MTAMSTHLGSTGISMSHDPDIDPERVSLCLGGGSGPVLAEWTSPVSRLAGSLLEADSSPTTGDRTRMVTLVNSNRGIVEAHFTVGQMRRSLGHLGLG